MSCWIYSFILSPLLIIANPCWRWSTSPGICPHAPIFETTFSNPSNFFSSNFCSIFLLCHSFLSPFPSTSFPSFFASPALFRAPFLSCFLSISTPLSLPSTLVMFTIFSSFLPLPSFANFSPSRQTHYPPYVQGMALEILEQDHIWSEGGS